jgi:curved DNA-binding protein CbpA
MADDADHGDQAQPAQTEMNRSEALAILGLTEEASEEDIVQAHRSLIQKLHPDRGGNNYLAAKINEAKDFLTR